MNNVGGVVCNSNFRHEITFRTISFQLALRTYVLGMYVEFIIITPQYLHCEAELQKLFSFLLSILLISKNKSFDM